MSSVSILGQKGQYVQKSKEEKQTSFETVEKCRCWASFSGDQTVRVHKRFVASLRINYSVCHHKNTAERREEI